MTLHRSVLLFVTLSFSWSAHSQYQFQRYLEDWSTAEGPAYKFIDLGAGKSLSFGGHLHARTENRRNIRGRTNQDSYTLIRGTLHADYKSERYRVFSELKSADSLSQNLSPQARPAYVDTLALEQLFLDWRMGKGQTLRLGRQTLLYKKPFAHTPRWRNTLRRWDGASWLYQTGALNLHAFWVYEALTRPSDYNRSSKDFRLAGAYAQAVLAGNKYDLYYLDFDRGKPVAVNGTEGNERRRTLGTRHWRSIGPGELYLEANLQFGHVGAENVSAQLYSAKYTLPLLEKNQLRMKLQVDVASGDDRRGGRVETFAAIYDQVHPQAGRVDLLGRSNLIDYSFGLSGKARNVTLSMEIHSFHRQSRNDAVYAPGGKVIAAPDGGPARIGEELDLRAIWKLSRKTRLDVGWGMARLAGHLDTAESRSSYTYLSLEHAF